MKDRLTGLFFGYYSAVTNFKSLYRLKLDLQVNNERTSSKNFLFPSLLEK
jgi:hypothetical protein